MLEQENVLTLIAEIAAAIAGFAALSGALADRGAPALKGFIRLRVVVSSGLLLLLTSIAPMVVIDFGLSIEATWRVCSVAAFGVNTFVFYQGISRSLDVDLSLNDRGAYLVFWPTEVICQLALLANVLNLRPEWGGSLYLTFLYSALVQTAWIFLQLLDSVLDPEAD